MAGLKVTTEAPGTGMMNHHASCPETMKDTTLATTRLRLLFLAARVWCHAGRVGVSYAITIEKKGQLSTAHRPPAQRSSRTGRICFRPDCAAIHLIGKGKGA